MAAEPRRCCLCGKTFIPSAFQHAQKTCSSPACQKRRKTEYHRARYRTDPEYRLVCRESDAKWRGGNAGYQGEYRRNHPAYVDQNRLAQRRRDRKRKMKDLVKNNLAFDVKSASADVWLVGPEIEHLVKNNPAISEVLIFQAVAGSSAGSWQSCKEHPPVSVC